MICSQMSFELVLAHLSHYKYLQLYSKINTTCLNSLVTIIDHVLLLKPYLRILTTSHARCKCFESSGHYIYVSDGTYMKSEDLQT